MTYDSRKIKRVRRTEVPLPRVQQQIQKLSYFLEREKISEYVKLLQKPWRMFTLNVISGIARGLGIALGFTIFTTLVVWFLKWLGALDLPIIGDYLADLVEAVQQQLANRRF
jgi:hypothetical protein